MFSWEDVIALFAKMRTSGWVVDVITITATFWIVLYFYFTRNFKHWKNKNVFYFPPVPFFGNAIKVFILQKNIGEYLRDLHLSTKRLYVGFFLLDKPCLLLRDPKLIKQILVKDFGVFNDRNIASNMKDDPMGSQLVFLLQNPAWVEMRRKMSPIFTSGKMKRMYQLIGQAGDDMINYLETVIRQNPVVEFREVSAKYTTDAVTSSAFGINANCFYNEDSEFRLVSRRLFNWNIFERAFSTTCYFIAPSLVKLLKLKFVDTESANFLRTAFWRTIEDREKSQTVRNDVLDIIIEMKKNEELDDPYKLEGDRLVALATQFFIGGYETTSSTITFALYELALNQDIQKILRNEINEVVEIHNGVLSYNSLEEMNYLEMCIKETLRKHPILPFLDRKNNADYVIPGTDVLLEKGTSLFISTWGLHFDPDYYPNPQKFDPTRFTPEKIQSRLPYTYLPFGEGPRSCVGARFGSLSVKNVVAQIIRKFHVELNDKTQLTMQYHPKGPLLAPARNQLYLKFNIL